MSAVAAVQAPETLYYPERDGKPMADNSKQFEEITKLVGNLDALFRDDPDVFVIGDMLWYPVEGNNKLGVAPDALVAFGRPKGHRGSYLQWLENNISPQVVFEILSPGNTPVEMTRKFAFYTRYGVEEYYVYDPDRGELEGWLRRGNALEEIEHMRGWVSPRLGIRFELNQGELEMFYPDGRKFQTIAELTTQLEQERQRADEQQFRAQQATGRADRLAAQLRALGITPED